MKSISLFPYTLLIVILYTPQSAVGLDFDSLMDDQGTTKTQKNTKNSNSIDSEFDDIHKAREINKAERLRREAIAKKEREAREAKQRRKERLAKEQRRKRESRKEKRRLSESEIRAQNKKARLAATREFRKTCPREYVVYDRDGWPKDCTYKNISSSKRASALDMINAIKKSGNQIMQQRQNEYNRRTQSQQNKYSNTRRQYESKQSSNKRDRTGSSKKYSDSYSSSNRTKKKEKRDNRPEVKTVPGIKSNPKMWNPNRGQTEELAKLGVENNAVKACSQLGRYKFHSLSFPGYMTCKNKIIFGKNNYKCDIDNATAKCVKYY